MKQLKTLEETFETVLHTAGFYTPEIIAKELMEAYNDWVECKVDYARLCVRDSLRRNR